MKTKLAETLKQLYTPERVKNLILPSWTRMYLPRHLEDQHIPKENVPEAKEQEND